MHALERVINSPEPLVLIGHSSEDRFPGYSYNAYTRLGKKFYCLVIWVHPRTAPAAVDLAHEAGCKRVWFSFGTGHPKAVARARELGLEVVEIGRCPVLYLRDKPAACKGHTLLVKASGLYRRPPQTDPSAKRREQL
jgi:hypothetical protein